MISIESVEFKNFLGYGDYLTKVDLNKYRGISSIVGEYDEDEFSNIGDEKRIGAGKSSICESIVWCIFGNLTYYQNPGDSVVNWNTGKNCFVKIKTVDGYEIIRTRKLSGSNELIILKDGDDITKSTTAPNQQFINNLFKIDYRTFITSMFFGQFNEGFLNISDAKRRSILERFIRITSFNSIAETAKDKSGKLLSDISVLESKIGQLNNNKELLEHEIESLLAKSKEFDNDKNSKIELVKKLLYSKKSEIDLKISSSKEVIKNYEKELSEFILINVDDLKTEWNEFNRNKSDNDSKRNKINELNQLKLKFEKKLNDINWEIKNIINDSNRLKFIDNDKLTELWDNYRKNELKFNELEKEISIIKDDIKDKTFKLEKLVIDIDNLTNVKEHQVCPKCFSNIDGENVKKLTTDKKNEHKELSDLLSDLQNDKDQVNSELNKIKLMINKPDLTVEESAENKSKYDALIAKKEVLNNNGIKISAAIKDIENSIKSIIINELSEPSMTIDEAKEKNDGYYKLKERIELKKSEIDAFNLQIKDLIKNAQDKIIEIKNLNNPFDALISEKRNKLNLLILDISNNNDELDKLRKLRMHVEYIRDSYNNKKKMRAFWISEIIPTLNKHIKYYFNTFEIEDDIEFDEFLNVKLNRWGYKTHSGGEKKRIDLSIMFALNDLHTGIFGPQCNLMVLDEVDGRIDPFTTNRLVTLLNDDIIKRDNGLNNIFVISHKEIMKDKFPNQIKVKNKGGNAYIVDQ